MLRFLQDLQRQLHEVTTELDVKKVSYAQVVEKARQQDAELQKRQAQLKAQLQRFQKFVYTNEDKTARANRRASAERETSHARDREIAVLQRQLAVDEVTCEGFETQVEGHVAEFKEYAYKQADAVLKFADYLKAASETSPEFSSVRDIIERFEVLASVHSSLREHEEKTTEQMDILRQQLQEYKRSQAAKILEANNKVAEYQRELEALEKETAALTAKADEADRDSFSKSLHLGKVLLAVENMYAMCITARPNIQHGRAAWERQRRESAAETDGEAQQEKSGTEGVKNQKRKEEQEQTESSQMQRRCRYAVELLAAIRSFIMDFKDIEEQLNKGEKRKQKANRTVNMAVEKPDEDTVEFVATRLLMSLRKENGSADVSRRTASRKFVDENSCYQQSIRSHVA
ncbi:hypothetical protein, conserved [Eimeria praecox]|uniref:DUF4200 domain-containing protein n=1 Tax=Eimeria praecox TaxID=51316 RepID=U6H998_9EIME|nr:hypothetical protein, conserved [Eimeria praecox]